MPDLVHRETAALAKHEQTGPRELLAFVTNGELYAVDLRAVQEIVVPPPITPVPRCPQAVVGVCSVRGQLLTVVDLRRSMGFPPLQEQPKNRILLGRSETDEIVGLRVDEVRQVVRLGAGELEMTSQALGGDVSEVVRGIGRPGSGEELVLLDMPTILGKGCR